MRLFWLICHQPTKVESAGAAVAAPGDPRRHLDEEQRWALENLRLHADWFESRLTPHVISPIKALRSWAFVLCFLCIGLSSRFKDLFTFGLKPFWAFTIGVAVNVPLGYLLTTRVFAAYWQAVQ